MNYRRSLLGGLIAGLLIEASEATWQLSARALLWGAAELVVAAAVAGWLYREPEAGAALSPHVR